MIIKEKSYQRLFLGLYLFSLLCGCQNLGSTDNSNPKIKVEQIYLWLCNMQQENGLLLSSEGGRYVSLYDNALAALAFTSYGDLNKAEKIFDFFNGKLESEFFQSPGGFGQLRTSDGIPVENSPRRWLGDNAWLLIALNNYHYKAQNTKYQQLATALSNWIISLQDEDGGVWGGFNEKGTRISKIAEGNIDAFNAVSGYLVFHKKLLTYLKNVRWESGNKIFVAWADNPAYRYALDLHSWSYCIFEDFPQKILTDAKRFETTQKSTATKKSIRGYCFDEDRDVVWLEGTGQMVVAFSKAKRENESQACISEMRKNLIQSSLYPGTYALPYTANFGTSYGSDELWDGVDTNPAVSSTVWYLFGMKGFDPFKIGYTKKIPAEDKFWIK